jgi:GNAT superfamily N-acetyltransferase
MRPGVAASPEMRIVELDAARYRAAIPALAALLLDVVDGGSSVNFLAGLTDAEATAWWTARIPDIDDGTITAFAAIDPAAAGAAPASSQEATRGAPVGGLVGSTLLIRSRNANATHRAEIGKVLVHRTARRRGLASALMTAVEARARADGRWLLILTTEADSAAAALYRGLGWVELGTMPDNARRVDGSLVAATYFWKDLRGAVAD